MNFENLRYFFRYFKERRGGEKIMKLGVGENKVAQVGLIMLSLIFLIILFWRKFSSVALILVIVIYLIVIRFAFKKPKRSQNTKKKALEKDKN